MDPRDDGRPPPDARGAPSAGRALRTVLAAAVQLRSTAGAFGRGRTGSDAGVLRAAFWRSTRLRSRIRSGADFDRFSWPRSGISRPTSATASRRRSAEAPRRRLRWNSTPLRRATQPNQPTRSRRRRFLNSSGREACSIACSPTCARSASTRNGKRRSTASRICWSARRPRAVRRHRAHPAHDGRGYQGPGPSPAAPIPRSPAGGDPRDRGGRLRDR